MATDYYCQIDKVTHGPLSAKDLKYMAHHGGLRRTDNVKATEQDNWVSAGSVKGLTFTPQPNITGLAKTRDAELSNLDSPLANFLRWILLLPAGMVCYFAVAMIEVLMNRNRLTTPLEGNFLSVSVGNAILCAGSVYFGAVMAPCAKPCVAITIAMLWTVASVLILYWTFASWGEVSWHSFSWHHRGLIVAVFGSLGAWGAAFYVFDEHATK